MTSGQCVHRATRIAACAAAIGLPALLASACDDSSGASTPTSAATASSPRFTVGQGSTPTFLGLATYQDLDKVKRITPDWKVELKAQGGLEVAVRSFAYDPGASTGWHKHPGPVLIQIIEGTVTFYEAKDPCTPIVVHAGEGYLDDGVDGHIGRNLTNAPAKDITINLAAPGTAVSDLRIDMDEPAGASACS